ncbi:MAG: hypothetical protein BWY21_01835 [Parcubacteria group bacterium ADurb.Bin216]|nr:MAG: hypothetical protein BWY21_01835 [Parcubacteria group bacterium ADurb.Bin216]
MKKYKGGGIIPSAQGGKSVIFAESPTLEIASAQDGLSAKLAPIKQKVREKLYRTVPPSDYPIRQLPSVVKNLITGRERMNSLDEINQLLEEREQLSPIIKQYEKDFSRAWDSSYGEGRHEAISKVTDKYGRELDELSRIEMRLDEISGGYDVVDEDLWRKYLEMPQLQGSVRPSRYKPAKAKDPSAEYFTIPDIVEDGTRNWKADVFKFAVEHDKGNGEFPTYDVPGPPGLARIKVDKGKDKKGEYYSIYDIYDFNIPGERLIGKPFEIYDRIYLDKDKKGNYTPRYQKGGEVSKYTPEYIEQLKQFENKPSNLGYHLDPKKIPTIGWGHRLTAEELKKKAVRVGKEWIPYEKFSGKEGRQYADRLMELDVAHHYNRLERQVGKDTLATLPPEVHDVLLDITYNRGSLGDSLEYVKSGDIAGLRDYLAETSKGLKGGAKTRMEWRANRIPVKTLPPVEAPINYNVENQYVPEVLQSIAEQPSTQGIFPIQDNEGYRNQENYGKPVQIVSNRPTTSISMDQVPFPILAMSDTGELKIMFPGEEHEFEGGSVTELPIAQEGASIRSDDRNWLQRFNDKVYSGYQEHKPQLFKDFPITDIVEPVVSYLTGHSDDESGGLSLLPYSTSAKNVSLYRVQSKDFNPLSTIDIIKDKVNKGEKLTWIQNNILNDPVLNKRYTDRGKFHGTWFEKDPQRLDYYLADKFDESPEILHLRLPKVVADKYNVKNVEGAIKTSLSPETEFVIPKTFINKATRHGSEEWSSLINKHKTWKQGGNIKKSNQLRTFTGDNGWLNKYKEL